MTESKAGIVLMCRPNEHATSIKGKQFFNQLNNCQFSRRNALRGYLVKGDFRHAKQINYFTTFLMQGLHKQRSLIRLTKKFCSFKEPED
jgi:hypothetical protein